jgi:phosphate uptake regulator
VKRKVIQIAGSTQLVSLPREWCKSNNIKKGQEVEVQGEGARVIISADGATSIVTAEVDISNLGFMTHRLIGSYYRAGVDELKILYNNPGLIESVHDSMSRETMVGVEIISQTENSSILKYLAGNLEEFDSVLRRTFLLLINMAEETTKLLKENRFEAIKNVSMLERTNNRLTTICRRIINKSPSNCKITGKVGPMYSIVESLENIADEYKYICQHYSNLDNKKNKLNQEAIKIFESASSLIRKFYELFYKFDLIKLREMKEIRDKVVKDSHKAFRMKLNSNGIWLVHHAIMITSMTFNMAGPFLVTKI